MAGRAWPTGGLNDGWGCPESAIVAGVARGCIFILLSLRLV
jgi:hypothetical protein